MLDYYITEKWQYLKQMLKIKSLILHKNILQFLCTRDIVCVQRLRRIF